MKIAINNKIKRVANQISDSGNKLKGDVKKTVRTIDKNHEKISDHADSVAKITKVAAGAAIVGAAAPTGLTAMGVAIGVVSAPAIVTAAPILVGAAGVAFTISAGASLYSKFKRKNEESESDNQED